MAQRRRKVQPLPLPWLRRKLKAALSSMKTASKCSFSALAVS